MITESCQILIDHLKDLEGMSDSHARIEQTLRSQLSEIQEKRKSTEERIKKIEKDLELLGWTGE